MNRDYAERLRPKARANRDRTVRAKGFNPHRFTTGRALLPKRGRGR